MSLQKRYLKSRPVCKVTFRIEDKDKKDADKVEILGDFNDWTAGSTVMDQLKDGTFKATVELEPDREYAFRYLIDEEIWENDGEADKFVPTEYGDAENSVIVI